MLRDGVECCRVVENVVIEREFSTMNRIIRSIDAVDLKGNANLGIKRGIGVVVVAHEEHQSTNLELAALSVGAQGGAICRVNDAHLTIIYGPSKIKELMNRLCCEDIYRVVNASSTAETPLVVIPRRLNKPYQVSVIPNPAEMTKGQKLQTGHCASPDHA
jgi:hypothetical protein